MISGPNSLGGGSGPGSRVAPDSSDLAVWRFNETSGTTFENVGESAGGDLTMDSGGFLAYPGGLHASTAFYSDASGTDTKALGGAGIRPSGDNFTISGWFMKKTTNTGLDWLLVKHDDSDGSTWLTPFYSVGFLIPSGQGRIQGYIRQNDSTTVGINSHPDSSFGPEIDVWHHIGLTHDGTTLSLYFDGTFIESKAAAFSISWGDDGPWRFNGNPTFSGEHIDGILYQDWRVAEVVRDADWFASVWNSR